MADNREKSGREGTPPLWANIPASGGLTFNTGNVPSLLMPVGNSPVVGSSLSDRTASPTGEEDHFLGESSSVAQQGQDGMSHSMFDSLRSTQQSSSSFEVGYGSVPTAMSQSLQLNTSSFVSEQSQSFSQTGVTLKQDQPAMWNPTGFQQPMQPPQVAALQQQQPQQLQPQQLQQHQAPLVSAPDIQSQMYNIPDDRQHMTASSMHGSASTQYTPITHHWFFCKKIMDQQVWTPFSYRDSMSLEDSFLNGTPQVVQTDGGRYDVTIDDRIRNSVYWREEPSAVQRCSWFYRDDTTMKYIPYDEDLSEELEEVYMNTVYSGSWHKRNEVNGSADLFVIHSPGVIVQFGKGSFPDEFGATAQSRPKVVKRGIDDLEPIREGENPTVDHIIFVVHGIGPVCDLKFRGIVECVDDMRSTSAQILSSHFKSSMSDGKIGRVEFLPIYWHDALRSDAVGVDRQLQSITLPSIKKLRQFTNEVLVDILFYNSPLYSQSIVEKVGTEMNRLYQLFMERNPTSIADVSFAGHSLGSLILFDLLSMQGITPKQPKVSSTHEKITPSSSTNASRSNTPDVRDEANRLETIETLDTLLEHLSLSNLADNFHSEQIDLDALLMCGEDDLKSIGLPLGPRKKLLKYVAEREKQQQEKPLTPNLETTQDNINSLQCNNEVSQQPSWLTDSVSNTCVTYVGGSQGIGLPLVDYPQLDFQVSNFFALGSPIAMFMTIRGVEHLSRDFQLPTCKSMFNIFHPFDPVAYRIEPMINPNIQQKPVLMPHHKGRKRLHLELKENLTKVGADLKQRLMRSLKNTWASINDFAKAHSRSETAESQNRNEEELEQHVDSMLQTVQQQEHAELESVSSVAEEEVEVGQLNQGRRIDYMLQESPLESFNDYLFSIASHLVYWESEDVSLMLMKEVYNPKGIQVDAKLKGGSPFAGPSVMKHAPFAQTSYSAPPPSSSNAQSVAPSPLHITSSSAPPLSGFVPSGPPPKLGFVPRHT